MDAELAAYRQNLRLLSWGYALVGVLFGFTGCIFFFHLFFGLFTLIDPGAFRDDATGEPMPVFFGLTMSTMGGCAILSFWTIAGLILLASRSLVSGRRKLLIYGVAVLMLMNFPLGSALAVVTFVLLSKPLAARVFEGE